MSVDQLPPRRVPRPSDGAKLVQYDEYIDKHIQNTRRAVKAVDWATALVMLGTGTIVFLLSAAIVEHWLVPGGYSVGVRIALFILFVGGIGYFAYWRLWPLCRRAINPVYAAQTIEQSSPTLKNSLINLLLFRQHRTEIPEAVYQTLEEQAAHRLTRVPVDAAVDRTHLIRFGYMLIGVVAIAALYKVLSPKDPWIAAERILMPWSDIVPASRVSIREVEPGSLTVSRGESLDVSADVRGLDEDEPVLLRYTTEDGQAFDKPVTMTVDKDGLRFEGRLPHDDGSAGKVGLVKNLHYRIEAGDARSRVYSVTVVAAPSVFVDRVEYDYPEYTGYIDRQVDDLGDIQAIEGTRITIHARANGPIRKAHIDFDADGRNDLEMTATEAVARGSFELALREDRKTPKHASYVLRFTNTDGRANRAPVKHPITVVPDLVPEIAILRPVEKAIDVRLNDAVMMEVEATDPDFALAGVRLHGEVGGRVVIDEPLLKSRHKGRFTRRYQFSPSAHDLRAGDVIQYWASASDIRTPIPNITESEKKLIRIISPDPARQPPPDRIAQHEPRQQRDRQQASEQQPQEGKPQDGANQEGQGANQQPGGAGQDESRPNEQPGANQPPQPGQQPSQQGGEAKRESQPDAQQDEPGDQSRQPDDNQGQAAQDGQSGEGQGEQSPPQNQPGGGAGQSRQTDSAQEGGNQNQSGGQGENSKQARPNQRNSNGKQTGAGAAGGDPSENESQPDGARPDENTSSRDQNGRDQRRPSPEQNAEPSTVSSEGDNDAEAFERIEKHLERNGQLNDGDKSRGNEMDQEPQPDAEQGQGDKQASRQGSDDRRTEDRADSKGGNAAESNSPEGSAVNQRPDSQTAQQPPTSANDQGEGTGAETRQDDLRDEGKKPSDDPEQSPSPGGQQTSSKGPSGAGQEPKNQGAPNSDPNMKPAEKRQQSGSDSKPTDKKEPSAGARGKRESDSQGEEGGDKAGGGEEGGGQKAPREGTGSAGQNQSADDGAGESSEKGAGNNSPNAGDDAQADNRTGQPGSESAGRGSKQREGTGEKPGGEAGVGDDPAKQYANKDPSTGETVPNSQQRQGGKETPQQGKGETSANKLAEQKPGNSDESSSGERGNEENGERRGTPTGDGGETGTESSPASLTDGVAPDGDAANLDYARKQTDLVLDKLADQLKRKQVDKNMLDQLGWTEADLRKFVDRWQKRKDVAQRNDPAGDAARRELNDALRSLGLRRGTLRQGPQKDDTHRDFREGYRGPVPSEYQDRLRAYNQGVSRERQNGE